MTPRAPSLFTPEEQAFLDRMFAKLAGRHPDLPTRFDQYAALPPEQRLARAQKDIYQVPRTGLVDSKVANPECVGQHIDSVVAFAGSHEPPAGTNLEHVKAMLRIHDLSEAITGDFTPSDFDPKDPNSGKEKHRLEQLAARILYQNHPEMMELFEEYMGHETPESLWAHDLDKLEGVWRIIHYEAKQPGLGFTLYKEFSETALNRLKTPEGQELAKYLDSQYDFLYEQWQARAPEKWERGVTEAKWQTLVEARKSEKASLPLSEQRSV